MLACRKAVPSRAFEPSVASGGARFGLLGLGLVLAVAVGAHLPALTGGFLFDDVPLIQDNAFVHSFEHWKHWLTTDFWAVSSNSANRFRLVYYRPLPLASYALDWWLGEGAPVVFHASNLILHALASVLAFLTLRRWLGAHWPAVAAAVLFTLHPTKTEAVAWISGRTELLLAIGVLLACHGMAVRLRGNWRAGVAIEALGTAVAYLSKEGAVMLPAFALIEAWVALNRPALNKSVALRLAWAAVPQAAFAVGYLVLRAVWLPIAPIPFWAGAADRFLMLGETLGRFARLLVLPYPLSVQQGLVRVSQGRFVASWPLVAAGLLVVGLLAWCAWRYRRSQPAIALGCAVLAAGLAPVSNLIPTRMLTLLAERFLYLPLLGVALVVGFGLKHARRPVVVFSLTAAVAAVFLGLSASRAAHFGDSDGFWQREAALHPDSPDVNYHLAREAIRAKKHAEALRLFARGHAAATQDFAHTGRDAEFGLSAVSLLAMHTPDLNVADLNQIASFASRLAMPPPGVANLSLPALQLSLPRAPADSPQSNYLLASAHSLQASVASRIGLDQQVAQAALEAARLCPGCDDVAPDAALALARVGRFNEAKATAQRLASVVPQRAQGLLKSLAEAEAMMAQAASLQGPPRVVARAQAFVKLGAWGRAYGELKPYATQFMDAPDIALAFAEISWKAGAMREGLAMAARHLPADDVNRLALQWKEQMGWDDELAAVTHRDDH